MTNFPVILFYSPKESLHLIMGRYKLMGPNFLLWKLHLKNILGAKGKLYVIENVPVIRPGINASDSEFDAFYRYQKDESDVMSIMLL